MTEVPSKDRGSTVAIAIGVVVLLGALAAGWHWLKPDPQAGEHQVEPAAIKVETDTPAAPPPEPPKKPPSGEIKLDDF